MLDGTQVRLYFINMYYFLSTHLYQQLKFLSTLVKHLQEFLLYNMIL